MFTFGERHDGCRKRSEPLQRQKNVIQAGTESDLINVRWGGGKGSEVKVGQTNGR